MLLPMAALVPGSPRQGFAVHVFPERTVRANVPASVFLSLAKTNQIGVAFLSRRAGRQELGQEHPLVLSV